MELYKLCNRELCDLCCLQERVFECIVADILGMINIDFTGDINKASEDSADGEIHPLIIPQIELLSFYITPIFEMESEMNKRGILKSYRESLPYIDYERERLLIYEKYEDRVSHLFNMHENGYLTAENVDRVSRRIAEEQRQKQLHPNMIN